MFKKAVGSHPPDPEAPRRFIPWAAAASDGRGVLPLVRRGPERSENKAGRIFNILQSEIALKVGILPRSETERQGGQGGVGGEAWGTNTKGSG